LHALETAVGSLIRPRSQSSFRDHQRKGDLCRVDAKPRVDRGDGGQVQRPMIPHVDFALILEVVQALSKRLYRQSSVAQMAGGIITVPFQGSADERFPEQQRGTFIPLCELSGGPGGR
jgi:hypothetical protein